MTAQTNPPQAIDTHVEFLQPAADPELLANSLLKLYAPRLKHVQACLSELTVRQASVLTGMEKQTCNFSEHSLQSTVKLMQTISAYKIKLVAIKRRMMNVHQRTQALKKRAIFIKDFKTKELEEKLRKQRQEEALIGDSGQSATVNKTTSLYNS